MAYETPEEHQKVQRKTEVRQRSQRNVQQAAPEQFRPQAAPVNMNMGVGKKANVGLDVLNGLNAALKGGAQVINQINPMAQELKDEEREQGYQDAVTGVEQAKEDEQTGGLFSLVVGNENKWYQEGRDLYSGQRDQTLLAGGLEEAVAQADAAYQAENGQPMTADQKYQYLHQDYIPSFAEGQSQEYMEGFTEKLGSTVATFDMENRELDAIRTRDDLDAKLQTEASSDVKAGVTDDSMPFFKSGEDAELELENQAILQGRTLTEQKQKSLDMVSSQMKRSISAGDADAGDVHRGIEEAYQMVGQDTDLRLAVERLEDQWYADLVTTQSRMTAQADEAAESWENSSWGALQTAYQDGDLAEVDRLKAEGVALVGWEATEKLLLSAKRAAASGYDLQEFEVTDPATGEIIKHSLAVLTPVQDADAALRADIRAGKLVTATEIRETAVSYGIVDNAALKSLVTLGATTADKNELSKVPAFRDIRSTLKSSTNSAQRKAEQLLAADDDYTEFGEYESDRKIIDSATSYFDTTVRNMLMPTGEIPDEEWRALFPEESKLKPYAEETQEAFTARARELLYADDPSVRALINKVAQGVMDDVNFAVGTSKELNASDEELERQADILKQYETADVAPPTLESAEDQQDWWDERVRAQEALARIEMLRSHDSSLPPETQNTTFGLSGELLDAVTGGTPRQKRRSK
ncbi:hypothetical protein N8077_04320 [Myxococcota bacterium]|nr:hypothetical protein [Myxococcota bacterium]